MPRKPRLSSLSSELAREDAHPKNDSAKKTIEANPERGQRSDFVKVTMTISPELLHQVKLLGLKRKARGEKDTDFSSLVREALADLLAREEQTGQE